MEELLPIWHTSIWAKLLGRCTTCPRFWAAAMAGVDVRLLVPKASDIPVMRAVSRAGFRGLLEAGVRIFEWNGPRTDPAEIPSEPEL